MPKISVVVPAYNAAGTLERCIRSIQSQDAPDFELLIVNDGSTDESGSVCRRFAESDPRIRYFEQPNGGLSAARNTGIEHAVGDYITFVDSDDYIGNGCFGYMLKQAEKTNADIVLCGYYLELGNTVRENRCKPMLLNGAYGKELIELKAKNLIDSAWNKLYRRDFLQKTGVRMPIGEIFEDTAFNLELLTFKPVIAVSDRCFYHYVQNAGSITKKYQPQKLETLKKRAIKLKEVSNGIEEYCDFYYVKSVFSALIDLFLCFSRREIMMAVSREIEEPDFIRAAQNAAFEGRSNRFIIRVARSRHPKKVYRFCRACYWLKYRFKKLFLRVRT